MAKSFDSETGTYTSPRPPVHFPENPNLSLTSFLFQSSSSTPHSLALADADTGETLTFLQLKTLVSRLARALIQLNINKDDVVLILSPNSIHFPVCFFSVVAIGAIATSCNPVYTVYELSDQIKDCNPKLIITLPELWHKIESFNIPTKYFSDLIRTSDSIADLPAFSVRQSDVAALLYSSGTTGKSKGVILTHRNFITESLMITSDQDRYGEPKHVFLCFVPMFHIMGMSVILYSQLRRGNAVVSMPKFDIDKALKAVEEYRVSQLFVVPPVMIALAKQSVVNKYDLSSVKLIVSSAAPLGKELMEETAKNIPRAAIVQGYGMTETCGMVSLENPREGSPFSGSTGTPAPGIESRIISLDTLKALPPNELREIWINKVGYTLEILDTLMKRGRLYVVDRLKELIKSYGYQVAPAELEGLLLSHPEILDAAVIPFPDAKAGEVPIAYVVRAPNSLLTEQDILKCVEKLVAPFKRLRSITFVTSVPKAASGKILRRELIQKSRSNM
ncbi:hypothetical protein ACLB2K_065678 [Fragaria x ananassa]